MGWLNKLTNKTPSIELKTVKKNDEPKLKAEYLNKPYDMDIVFDKLDKQDNSLKSFFKTLWDDYLLDPNKDPTNIINFLMKCYTLDLNNDTKRDNLLKNITCDVVKDGEWQPFIDYSKTKVDNYNFYDRVNVIIVRGRSICKYGRGKIANLVSYKKMLAGKRRTKRRTKRHSRRRKTRRSRKY